MSMTEIIMERDALKQQLANATKQNVLLRDALGMAMDYFNGMPWASSTVVNCKEALAATQDLAGLVVCDAEPAGTFMGCVEEGKAYQATHPNSYPLYKAKELK
jgi:hypothetical protein